MSSLTGVLLAGTYRLGACLGQGNMGAVYEATQEGLGRRVAIKVLLDQGQVSSTAMSRFQREARAAAQLGHPNIIQVTDFRSNPGEPAFIVMERLEGESLESAIKREGRLPPERVLRIGQQVLEALIAAHQAGIVHRDIKPANLFLTQVPGFGELVKVIDFGIAKLQGSVTKLTAEGASIGTPLYAPPELLWGTPSDARADIYSLGATMYHALTGQVPILSYSLPEFLALMQNSAPVPVQERVPEIAPQFAHAVMTALAKDPASRFSSAAAMRDALKAPLASPSASLAPRSLAPIPQNASMAPQALAGTMVSATAPAPVPTPSGSSLVLKVLLAAFAGIVLLGVAGVALYFALAESAPSSSGTARALDGSVAPRPTLERSADPLFAPTLDPSAGRAPANTARPGAPTALPSVPSALPTPSSSAAPSSAPSQTVFKGSCSLSRGGEAYLSPETVNRSFADRSYPLSQCAIMGCYSNDPRPNSTVDHSPASYSMNVDAMGNVSGLSATRCPQLDGCMKNRVFNMPPLPRPLKPGSIGVSCDFSRSR